jgi:isopentenyl phosphate kinase
VTDLVFVKLGGSLITDKSRPYTLREDVLKRLAGELAECVAAATVKVVVGHGAGSFPHHSATRFQTHRGIVGPQSVRGLCEVSRDVFRLDRLVIDALLDAGIPAMPFQPSAARLSEGGVIKQWLTAPIEHALGIGVIPVVFGDLSMDLKMGVSISSTEDAFDFLAKTMRPRRVVMGARVDGVLDDTGRVIPEVRQASFDEVSRHFSSADGEDVTGGMRHKVERMLQLAAQGSETVIVSGLSAGRVRDAVLGRPVIGTRVAA